MPNFPPPAIEQAGYGAVWRGQKSWNGVAILARGAEPIVTRDRAARRSGRHAGALHRGRRQRRHRRLALCAERQSAAGAEVRLQARLASSGSMRMRANCSTPDVPVVLAGDYNVVPTDVDIYPTKSYAKDALLQPESRAAVPAAARRRAGSTRCASCIPTTPMYTFWDYMRNRWPRDAGLRLDHLLLSKSAAPTAGRCRRRPRRARRGRRQRPCAGLDRAARRCRAPQLRAPRRPSAQEDAARPQAQSAARTAKARRAQGRQAAASRAGRCW